MINCFNLEYVRKKTAEEFISEYFDCSKPLLSAKLSKKVEHFLNKNIREQKRRKGGYSYYWSENRFFEYPLGRNKYYSSSEYEERIYIGLDEGFIKDSTEKLYDVVQIIDPDEKIENIIDELFKQAATEDEKFFVYSLVISHYFVVDDYKNFEKYILEAFKYTNTLSKERVNSSLFYVTNPSNLSWQTKSDDEHFITAKMKIWSEYVFCTKKLESFKSYSVEYLTRQIHDGIAGLYKRFYLEDKDTLRKYQIISSFHPMVQSMDRTGQTTTLNIYDRTDAENISNDEFLDLLECSPSRIKNSIINFSSYYDGNRFKDLLNNDDYRNRLFEIVKNYLISEFGKKRSNRNLRGFLKSFSNILTFCNKTFEMMEFINDMPENISGEVLKQMVGTD